MDSLAREPERLTTPHNTDTGETILHLLAKVFFFLHLYPINPTSAYHHQLLFPPLVKNNSLF